MHNMANIAKPKAKVADPLTVGGRGHKLDGRTSEAKTVQQIKDGLTDTPSSTAKAILVDLIARNTTIERAIYHKALNDGTLFDSNGKLNPLIDKQMLKFQSAGKAALVELLKLEGKQDPESEADSLFDDIFDADEG